MVFIQNRCKKDRRFNKFTLERKYRDLREEKTVGAKALIVERITITPILDADEDQNGFIVKGTKEENVVFLISGIRRLIISYGTKIQGRTRILWLRSKAMEIREDVFSNSYNVGKRSIAFMVSFEKLSSVIIQGEPLLTKNSFQGQMIRLTWGDENIEVVPQVSNTEFLCKPNHRTRQIEVTLV